MSFDKKNFADIYDNMIADTRRRLPELSDFEELAEKLGMQVERTTVVAEYDDYPAVIYATERPS